MAHKPPPHPLLPHLVRLREPSIELGGHEAGFAHEIPVLDDAMTPNHGAMHDRDQPPIPIVHFALFEEPRLDRGEILIPRTDEPPLLPNLLHLPFNLLPHGDAIAILRRLPEFHEFKHLRRGRTAYLHPARCEVSFNLSIVLVCRKPLGELT